MRGNVGSHDPDNLYHGIWVWGVDHADIEDNQVDYAGIFDAGTDVTAVGNVVHSLRMHSDTSDVVRCVPPAATECATDRTAPNASRPPAATPSLVSWT